MVLQISMTLGQRAWKQLSGGSWVRLVGENYLQSENILCLPLARSGSCRGEQPRRAHSTHPHGPLQREEQRAPRPFRCARPGTRSPRHPLNARDLMEEIFSDWGYGQTPLLSKITILITRFFRGSAGDRRHSVSATPTL